MEGISRERDRKGRGAEFGIWEKQPGSQFIFSYTGKMEGTRR